MEIDIKNITGVTSDSRAVKPGFVFVAIKGLLQDGHEFIDMAIASGAKIIIHQDEIKKQKDVQYYKVKEPRIILSQLASLLYPKQPKYIIGVTGTNGKTSIVHFFREILQILGRKVVSIGTMGVLGAMEESFTNLNTLSAEKLHPMLQKITEDNIDYVVMECSSHGMDQHRIDNVRFTACGFSNFTQDHLDYHHTMEKYFAAKEKLFSIYKNGYAVLNTDILEYEHLEKYCHLHNQKTITYGRKAKDIIIKSIEPEGTYQKITWEIFGTKYYNLVNLVGEFQIYNLACAIGLLFTTGIAIKDIINAVDSLKSVSGRMELILSFNNANIFVDYAHTPDALENALSTLKKVTKNELWLVFGCGGDRDKEKRPLMGQIAKKLASKIIVTDDNPRNEDPSAIRQEILKECKNAIEIADRHEAIKYALSQLKSGDNLLVAGKGHENYQIIGEKKLNFSDKETVLKVVSNANNSGKTQGKKVIRTQ